MKKLKILVLVLFAYLSSYAQDPQLFENDWYLQKVIIDGQDNFPPSNNEVPFITVVFNAPMFETAVCDVLTAEVNYNGTLEFDLFNWGVTLGGCNEQENTDFQVVYLDTFFVDNITDSFTYTITNESNGSKTLSITSINGNKAIYNSVLLSTQDFSKAASISIYPNPVKDDLFISGTIDMNDVKINIFDVNGKLVLSLNNFDANNKSINVQKLNSGIYFIFLKDNQGRTAVKKFIKN